MGKQGKKNQKQHQQQPNKKAVVPSPPPPPNPSSKGPPKKAEKDVGPPFEISIQEYKDLCQQVKDLSLAEIQEEWILAARYGDLDVIAAIRESPQFQQHAAAVINCQDNSNGNTALHMAAANGHLKVVDALLNSNGIDAAKVNHAGNTPLHWAASNGQDKVVELLLKRIKDIDVLQKNEFGRSALTEGFTSQKTEVIKHLLEHDSAAEEKLLQGGQEIDADEDDNAEEEKENASDNNKTKEAKEHKPTNPKPQKGEEGIVHEFNFLAATTTPADDDAKSKPPAPLKIRELPIPANQDPFGDRRELDTTGYGIWAASLVMARWMAASSKGFDGKRILELGAGCGVPGLAAAYYSNAKHVYLTDLNPKTIDNLKYNIQLNNDDNQQHHTGVSSSSSSPWMDRVSAGPINWEDPNTWPKERIDYIIGSDLIYQASIAPILKKVVLGLCQGQGTFLYVAPNDIGRDGLEEFIQAMKDTQGCELLANDEGLAPKEYHANPLASQDDDECFLHFHELTSATYRLYEFQINVQQ